MGVDYSKFLGNASKAFKNRKCLLLLDLGFAAAAEKRKPITRIDLRPEQS